MDDVSEDEQMTFLDAGGGEAFWTCPSCGGAGERDDRRCRCCGGSGNVSWDPFDFSEIPF